MLFTYTVFGLPGEMVRGGGGVGGGVGGGERRVIDHFCFDH